MLGRHPLFGLNKPHVVTACSAVSRVRGRKQKLNWSVMRQKSGLLGEIVKYNLGGLWVIQKRKK